MRYGLCQPPSALLPLRDMLQSHLQKVGGWAAEGVGPAGVRQSVAGGWCFPSPVWVC